MGTHKAWDKQPQRPIRILGCSKCLRPLGRPGDSPMVRVGKATMHERCRRNGYSRIGKLKKQGGRNT